MTFQLRIDKNSFQFHIIFLGMNPIKDDWPRWQVAAQYRETLSNLVSLMSGSNNSSAGLEAAYSC